MNIISLAGKPFDLGLSHGRALADAIAANYEVYSSIIMRDNKLSADALADRVDQIISLLEKEQPAILSEMRGIAQGAGLDLHKIVVINARTELAYCGAGALECTTFGLDANKTKDGRAVIAQNWDWLPMVQANIALLRINPQDGPRMLLLVEAGQVGKIGLNEHGLCVVINLMIADMESQGLPMHVLLRRLMSAADVNEARSIVEQCPIGSSFFMLISDAQDRLLGLEASPMGIKEIPPSEGMLVHTNHFCHPELEPYDLVKGILPDTSTRLTRARELMTGRSSWDSDSLKKVLQDHEDYPNSICRHPDNYKSQTEKMATLSSIIMEPAKGLMRIAMGNPCRCQYQTLRI